MDLIDIFSSITIDLLNLVSRCLKNITHETEEDIESGQLSSSVTSPSKTAQQQQEDWSQCYTTIDRTEVVNRTGSCIGDQCTICLGKFEEEEDECVMLRNCKHAYHRICIDKWLPESCPVCRQSIIGVEQ